MNLLVAIIMIGLGCILVPVVVIGLPSIVDPGSTSWATVGDEVAIIVVGIMLIGILLLTLREYL